MYSILRMLDTDTHCGTGPCKSTLNISNERSFLQFLEEAGFCNVRAEDRTAQFIEVIEAELKRAEAIKEEFIQVSMCTSAEFIFARPVCGCYWQLLKA